MHQLLGTIIDLKREHKVLILGIGRSNIIDILYAKGYREIVAIDISPSLINALQKKYEGYSGITCMYTFLLEFHVYFMLSQKLLISLRYGCSRASFIC